VPFSPEEIESKEFLITLRGYDKDEVNAFLRAVAADYRSALSRQGTDVAVPSSSYEALGAEISTVLSTAKQSAETIRRRAEDDATELRRRAEEESRSLREAASRAAKRLTEEAERHSIEVRASAEREASDRLRESARRVERLQATETKVRQRLFSLEATLKQIRQELEAVETAGADAVGKSLLEARPAPTEDADETILAELRGDEAEAGSAPVATEAQGAPESALQPESEPEPAPEVQLEAPAGAESSTTDGGIFDQAAGGGDAREPQGGSVEAAQGQTSEEDSDDWRRAPFH
jgi:DivIVA domain-containing protein